MTADSPDRRYEFDWLRVGAILVVFLYHSTRFFNQEDWHVKNAATYVWVDVWIRFASTWLMPLFFMISGAGLFYALEKPGGWRKFYTDKFLRLMVPVLVASVSHSALQVYLERLSHGHFTGSFLAFIPGYFNGLYVGIGLAFGNFAFQGTHLWYLLFLFLYSMICYRLFIWLKANGRKILDRMATLLAVPGLIYVYLSIPLLVMYALIPPSVLNVGAGAWGFLYYLWFLVSGFILVSSERLRKTVRGQRWISLLLGVVFSTLFFFQGFRPSYLFLPHGISHWLPKAIYFLSAWCWLLAILGFGMRRLAFDRPFLRYANEAVLPFYILHQSVLVIIGYFVMPWEIHVFLKWAISFAGAFTIIITLYVTVVRKYDLFRFLFGMKTTKSLFMVFRKKPALVGLHMLYAGLIVFALMAAARNCTPVPMVHNPGKDIVLNASSIKTRAYTGVHIVNDDATSIGSAVEFSSGANERAQSCPQVYVDVDFVASAGRYTVWLRGKSDSNDMTDSVWLQVDDCIGTRMGGFQMGNWRDIHPEGVYAWAGDANRPVTIELKHAGNHTIRIQPRQTPHRIDQIWLSRSQRRIPDTYRFLK